MEKFKHLHQLSSFQRALLGLTLAGFALLCATQAYIYHSLQHTQSQTRPLLDQSERLVDLAQNPYLNQAVIESLLSRAASELAHDLDELANSHIRHTVHISQSVPVMTEIKVNQDIIVPINLDISGTIPIAVLLPLEKQVMVPINLEIDQNFPISANIPFKDEIRVPINDTIYIDEKFKIRVLGQTIQIPVRGDIPVKMDVQVPISKTFSVQTSVPVRFPISETLPVQIDWQIPVSLEMPIYLPIETELVIPFEYTFPLDVRVPVVLDVPIDIALGDTAFGAYLNNLAGRLSQIISQTLDLP